MRNIVWLNLLLLALPVSSTELSAGGARKGTGRLVVFASVAPHAYLAERIGGKHVTVQVLIPKGQDPHTFEPSPRQMTTLGKARLYFCAELPFESRLLPKVRSVHRNLTVVTLAPVCEEEHSEDPHPAHSDDHAEGGVHDHDAHRADPHSWLSPVLLEGQARMVAAALSKADPGHAEVYSKNLARWSKELRRVDTNVSRILKPYKGRSFYVFHPAFGSFAEAYGLRQEAVEFDGKSPTPKRLAALIQKARRDDVRVIFVQPQFDTKSVAAVATAIGGSVAVMDPLAADVLRNLERMALEIRRSFKKESPAARGG